MNFFKILKSIIFCQVFFLGACSTPQENCANKNFYTQFGCEIQRDTQTHSKNK